MELLTDLKKQNVFFLWILYILVVVVVKFDTDPTPGNVFNIYRQAGLNWINSESIYASGAYLYYPFTTFIFIPFTYVPFEIGGALWRAINILVFALGLCYFSRSSKEFLIVSFICIFLSWAAARHGQVTLAMAGFMLMASNALDYRRYCIAAFFISMAFILKPLSIVFLLLVLVLYPRVIPGTVFFVFLLVGISFITQSYDYVLEQLQFYPSVISSAIERSEQEKFLHVFAFLEYLGIELNHSEELIIQLISAAFVLILAFYAKVRANNFPLILYTLSVSYILLMGSGTEKNTYVLMAPVFGFLIYSLWVENSRKEFYFVFLLLIFWLTSHVAYKGLDIRALYYTKPMLTLILTYLFIRKLKLLRASEKELRPIV